MRTFGAPAACHASSSRSSRRTRVAGCSRCAAGGQEYVVVVAASWQMYPRRPAPRHRQEE